MGYTKSQIKGEKSLVITFILWLFGGLFGLHHFYLHRDRQAFVWWSTLGGCGLGWFSDLFRLSRYVRDANEDPKFISEFIVHLQKNKKPPFSGNRFSAAILVAYSWGQMFISAVPIDDFAGINWKFLYWLTPLPVALGVWTVGNIGRQKGSLKWALVSACICQPLRYFIIDDTVWITLMVFCSALVFDTYSKEWRRTPPKRNRMLKRLTILGFCACLYMSLWVGFFFFNGTVTDSEGDEIPIHEAVYHFFNSPWWVDLQQSLYDTYQYAQHHGWYEIWKQIIDLSDPSGEQNAYKVLGVGRDASQQEITAKWRKLSREFHPDKEREAGKREQQQEQFLQIQQAYEILSNTKSRRNRKNKKDNAEFAH